MIKHRAESFQENRKLLSKEKVENEKKLFLIHMKPRGFYMPELLLKSACDFRMWLQGAVVSWTIFNPVGWVRQGVNLQVDLYADHPAALVLIWKMQEECSLLYKEIDWKGKKIDALSPKRFC